MKLSERLDIAAKIHEDMSGKTALSTTIREAADFVRGVERHQVEAGGCASPVVVAQIQMNQRFGNPEQLALNEPSGDSGQLASLEQRAREPDGYRYRVCPVHLRHLPWVGSGIVTVWGEALPKPSNTIEYQPVYLAHPSPASQDDADKVAALANQQGVGNGWRCFYCDETFTDREAAALHFGEGAWPREDTPACQIDIAEYRRMEAVQRRYQDEDADCHRALHRQANEHHLALQRAEEAGYARGLKDSGQCPCSASTQPAGDVGSSQ